MKSITEAKTAMAELDRLYNLAHHDPKLQNYCLALANRRQTIAWMLNEQSINMIAPSDNPHFVDVFASDIYDLDD